MVVLLNLLLVLLFELAHDLLRLVVFGLDAFELDQFLADLLVLEAHLLPQLLILNDDLFGLSISVLQCLFFELLLCLKLAQQVTDFLLIFEVLGVVVHLLPLDLLRLALFLLEVALILVVLSPRILFRAHAPLPLLIDLLLDGLEIVLCSKLLQFLVLLQQLAALILQPVQLLKSPPVLLLSPLYLISSGGRLVPQLAILPLQALDLPLQLPEGLRILHVDGLGLALRPPQLGL